MNRFLPVLLALSLVAGIAPVRAETAPEPLDEAAKRILTESEFVFCQESKRAMPRQDREWCAISEEARTCPELKAMCERKLPIGDEPGVGAAAKGGKLGQGDAGGAPPRQFSFPEIPFLDLLAWLVVGGLVALVIFLVVRAVLNRRPNEPAPEVLPDVVVGGPLEIEAPALGEVALLLRQARAMADEDVTRAVTLLYAAALKHLEEKGLIQWESATTNREYVRRVRGKTPLDRPLAELVREVERAKFGNRAPTRARFDELFNRIAPAVARAAALVLVAFLSGCSSCAPGDASLEGRAAFNDILKSQGIRPSRFVMPIDEVDGDDPPVLVDAEDLAIDANVLVALERSVLAGGRVLLLLNAAQPQLPAWPDLQVLDAMPPLVTVCEIALPDAGSDAGLEGCVPVEPDAGTPSDGGESDGARVVEGGVDGGAVDAGGPKKVTVYESRKFPLRATEAFAKASKLDPANVGWLPNGLYFQVPEDERDPPEVLVEREGKPFAVRWRTERGVLVVVADRRLFSNGAMAIPSNVHLAMALAKAVVDTRLAEADANPPAPPQDSNGAPPTEGSVEGPGEGGQERSLAQASLAQADPADSPMESLARSGLWALLLQALLAVALFYVARGASFGTLRDRSSLRRREFSEHIAALGVQLERRRSSRFTGGLYATWVLERLWQRTGREAERNDPASLARVLAPRLGEDETTLRRLLEQADSMRREPHRLSVPESDLDLIRALGRLLQKLGEQRS